MSTNAPEKNVISEDAEPASTMWFMLGLLGAAVATVASLMLAWQHITGAAIPGCGPDSGCRALARSAWGKVPGLGLPVSFVGTAYFGAMLVAWIVARGRITGPLRGIVWLGAVLSLVFLIVMFGVEKHFCQYCLIAHLGNFLFVLAVALGYRPATAGTISWQRSAGVMAGGFVLALGGMLVANTIAVKQQEQRDEDALAKDIERVLDTTTDTAVNLDSAYGPDNPFTGRWHLGEAESPIRIVMFFDYQCVDCKRLEGEMMQLVESRDDVSLSVKHFPMSSGCNVHVPANPHPNACWAARAAEAAGILGGKDAFWRMHEWLFTRPNAGSFTNAELSAGLPGLGFDRDTFVATMSSDETLNRVKSDIEEAVALGLHYTPMIFINGVELQGWNARDSVKRAVESLAAENPEPRTAAVDMPPPAIGKYIEDWRAQRIRPIQTDTSPHVVGPDDADHTIIVWIDYEHSATVQFNTALNRLIRERDDLSIDVRHYPVDESCNPLTARTAHPNACSMHRAVEAAGILGGDEAFWKMHNWVINNQKTFSQQALSQAAAGFGLDASQLLVTMNSQQVTDRIQEDCRSGKAIGLRSVPWPIIDGKYLPRWRLNKEPIIDRILEASAADQSAG